MTITVRQAMCVAAATILMTMLVMGLGLGFPLSPIGRATLGDHSAHIALWMAFFLALVSIIYQFIQLRSELPERSGAWTLALIALYLLAGFLMVSEWQAWRFTKDNWHSGFKVLALVGSLLFLIWMRFLPFLQSLPTASPSATEVRKWGRLVAVLVMLLAMFAFGIEIKEQKADDGQSIRFPSVKWTELPAILIVFVLADFGLELVVLSMESDVKIRSAADDAKKAAADAESAVSKLGEAANALNNAKDAALQSVQTLSTWVGATHHIQQQLSDGAIRIPGLLQLKNDDYFRKLFCFSRSWVPAESLGAEAAVSLGTETGRLVGDLFTEFVGAKEEDGTVRRFGDGVCCITADAVFAEVSKRWLGKITKDPGEGGLVVYALTTLLPSEFAFPSAYRGRGDFNAARISSLYQFSSAVLSSCAGQRVSEYRRITVFEEKKTTTFNKLAQGDGSGLCSLDTWFVFDPRTYRANGRGNDAERVLDDFLAIAENSLGIHPQHGLTMSNLRPVFAPLEGLQKVPPEYEDTRPDIFPYHSSVASPSLFIVDLPERGRMAVFGPVTEGVNGPKVDGDKCSEWLRANGWLSLRDWYCRCLHKAPDGQEGAWWAVLNGSSDSVIENFCIEWDKTRVTTLDLLLIGSRGNDGLEWYGAAISNLAFDRTECTVQLVTNEQRLVSLANSVTQLCNGFQRPADRAQFPLQSFGTWSKWPAAEWSSSEASKLRAAAADSASLTTGGEKVGTEQPTPQPPEHA